jgi:predicted AAA+ superfamily ATPase
VYPRLLTARIREALRDTPVVAISGPRQSGKTTLARQFASGSRKFVDLDDLSTLSAAKADPSGFISRLDRAVIDEIQRAPELLLPIKQAVDADRRPGRFLLTGSANIFAMPQVMDSLAERVESLELYPLAASEIARRSRPGFFERAFSGDILQSIVKPVPIHIESVMAGGYPAALARRPLHRRRAWYRAYVRSLIDNDVAEVARLDKLTRFPRLISVAAQLSAQLVNLSEIARHVQLDYKTIDHYLTVLERLYVLRRLAPWHRNELKRITKTPKLHFIDAGVLSTARGAAPMSSALDRTRLGPILESYVFGELLKLATVADHELHFFHYRDKDKVEVDFIVENSPDDLIGIEVKCSTTIQASDFRGLERLRSIAGSAFRQGILLYTGESALSFGDRLAALPLSFLAN